MANSSALLTDVFHALADPTRRAIAATLGRGPESVSTLAAPFPMALPSFMQHLSVLERCGVVRSRKDGRVRTCALVPHANPAVAGAGDLVISRLVLAPRARLWRACTEPALLQAGWGHSGTSDRPGSLLEVVPQQRPVLTSCLLADGRPATPWMAMTAIITLADEGAGTRHIAHLMHPDAATRDRHPEMGFHDGRNTCVDQLDAIALQLPWARSLRRRRARRTAGSPAPARPPRAWRTGSRGASPRCAG